MSNHITQITQVKETTMQWDIIMIVKQKYKCMLIGIYAISSVRFYQLFEMGAEQPRQMGKVSKTQIEMACLKAKIHLELMRDRKNNDIIKGEKELVGKIKQTSRNRTEQALIMERVVNGLKYSQAVNQLMSYAASLRSQASFISDNVRNHEKLQPWLQMIHTLLYAADHLGLSSLNEFKNVMKALNNPQESEIYVNPDIKDLLSPSPTPYEMNLYVLEMVQRNGLSLELINSAGHQFRENPEPPSTQKQKSFQEMELQLADQFKKNMDGGNQGFGSNPGFGGGNQGFGGNQGGQGYGGNQGGQGYGGNQGGNNPGGYGGNQGFGGSQGGNQGFGGNNGGFGGGFNSPNVPNMPNVPTQVYGSNPYKEESRINDGPSFYNPSNYQKKPYQKPNQFKSIDSVIKNIDNPNEGGNNPIYPSVDFQKYQPSPYQPVNNNNNNNNNNYQAEPAKNSQTKSPTISQIMRDFDVK